MSVLAVLGAGLALGLAWLVWCCVTAPYGWQDRHGFHRGTPPGEGGL